MEKKCLMFFTFSPDYTVPFSSLTISGIFIKTDFTELPDSYFYKISPCSASESIVKNIIKFE